MKKKYIKTAEGVLVSATPEQIADGKVEKFEVEFPDPVVQDNPMKDLENVIRALAGDTKDAVEKMNAQMAAFAKAQEKGLVLPGPLPSENSQVRTGFENIYEKNAKMAGMTTKEAQDFFGEYDLALQGKELQDKYHHPNHIIDEPTRIEMAKYYCLLLRSLNDPRARSLFIDTYGVAKTNIGDSGNTFIMPKPIEAEILAFAREVSILLQFARVWPMTSDKMGIPAEASSTTVAWGNETPPSDPGITDIELSASELSAYSTVRNTTLADTVSDVVGWLNSNLAEAAGQELDNQGFNGTGSPFRGLLIPTYGAYHSVVTESSSIANMEGDDLSKMISKLDGKRKLGARFYMHGEILHYVRILKSDVGVPIWLAGNIAGGMPPGIHGYPYSEVPKMPSTDEANHPFILFGNLNYYAVGRRLDVATLSVNPYLGWTTNRTSFKLYQRWAMIMGLRQAFVRLLTAESEES